MSKQEDDAFEFGENDIPVKPDWYKWLSMILLIAWCGVLVAFWIKTRDASLIQRVAVGSLLAGLGITLVVGYTFTMIDAKRRHENKEHNK